MSTESGSRAFWTRHRQLTAPEIPSELARRRIPVRRGASSAVNSRHRSKRFRPPRRSPGFVADRADDRNPHGGAKVGLVAVALATASKTVSGRLAPTRVRIPPPPSCEVSVDPGHMSREIPDSLSPSERLVDARGVERELADQLALWVDHADVLFCDQET